jgi:hypothetical protein
VQENDPTDCYSDSDGGSYMEGFSESGDDGYGVPWFVKVGIDCSRPEV